MAKPKDSLTISGDINPPDKFAELRENIRGTFPEIMKRYWAAPDFSVLSKDAKDIYQ